MPTYTYVDLDFEPYVGPTARSTGVFVKPGKAEPITGDLGKDWWPKDSPRQPYFEAQVARISAKLNSRCVPAHMRWRTGECNQLDKGCIGHSFSEEYGFIESIARNYRGEITHIIIRNNDAPNN